MSIVNNISNDFYDKLNNFGSNPVVLVILIFVILIYYLLFAFLGTSQNSENVSSGGFVFVEAILWGLFIILVFVNGVSYFFNINVVTEISDLFLEKPEIQIQRTTDISNLNDMILDISTTEVYHVPGNRFTYNDAKAICKAFDGEMATFDQVYDSQKKGASWCSYGWTKDKLGLYPTSKSDWDKLQQKEGHKYDCGMPGINGGPVKNPHIKMGANCYGVKPEKSKLEELLDNKELYPKTLKEHIFDERVKFWKNRIGNVLILPFNNNNWFKVS